MNAATFRALRETCGIPQSAVAEALGVRVQTVKNWEKGAAPVPEDAAEWLGDRLDEHDRAVGVSLDSYEEALAGIEGEVGELDGLPPCVLTYWRTQGEYDRHGRDPGSHSVVNARVRDVATGLREMGCEVEFRYWDEGAIRTPGSRY